MPALNVARKDQRFGPALLKTLIFANAEKV
jgi:hypothetical protein